MTERCIIMLKDLKTGILEKELCAFDNCYEGQLYNIYAYEEDGRYLICMELTTGIYISDENFDSVYDYYNEDFSGIAADFFEVDDCENPSWEVTVPYTDNEAEMQQLLNEVMVRHVSELERVYKQIINEEG